MTSARAFRSVAAQRLARLAAWSRSHDLFPGAFCLCLGTMFLINSNHLPKDIYYVAVLPLGVLVAWDFALRTIRHSTILWAMALYLSMIGISGLAQPGMQVHHAFAYFRHTLAVLSFLIATAYLMQDDGRFLRVLFLTVGAAAAISAGFNVAHFLQWGSQLDALSNGRLVASLGMPGYENSTNIAITYAVLLVASAGTLAAGSLSRLQRGLLSASLVALLVALLLTESRGPWAGAAAGSLSLILADRRRRVQLAGVAVLLVVSLAVAITMGDSLLARGDSYRLELWGRYLVKAADSPWLGYGLWTDIKVRMRDGIFIVHPHNLLLSAQIRGGLLSSFALLFAFWAAFRWALKLFVAQRLLTPFALMLTIAVAGCFDYDLFSTAPEWPWVTFWLPIGLCVGAEMRTGYPSPPAIASNQDGAFPGESAA